MLGPVLIWGAAAGASLSLMGGQALPHTQPTAPARVWERDVPWLWGVKHWQGLNLTPLANGNSVLVAGSITDGSETGFWYLRPDGTPLRWTKLPGLRSAILAVDSAGAVVAAGRLAPDSGRWVVQRYSPDDGVQTWPRQSSLATAVTQVSAVTVDRRHAVVVTGATCSAWDSSGSTCLAPGWFVTKLDGLRGAEVWTQEWRYEAGEEVPLMIGVLGNDDLIVALARIVAVDRTQWGLLRLRTSDGAAAWGPAWLDSPGGVGGGRPTALGVAPDDSVVVAGERGTSLGCNSVVQGFDGKTGVSRWGPVPIRHGGQRQFGPTSMVLDGNAGVIVSTASGRFGRDAVLVTRLDARDGSIAWQVEPPGPEVAGIRTRFLSPAILALTDARRLIVVGNAERTNNSLQGALASLSSEDGKRTAPTAVIDPAGVLRAQAVAVAVADGDAVVVGTATVTTRMVGRVELPFVARATANRGGSLLEPRLLPIGTQFVSEGLQETTTTDGSMVAFDSAGTAFRIGPDGTVLWGPSPLPEGLKLYLAHGAAAGDGSLFFVSAEGDPPFRKWWLVARDGLTGAVRWGPVAVPAVDPTATCVQGIISADSAGDVALLFKEVDREAVAGAPDQSFTLRGSWHLVKLRGGSGGVAWGPVPVVSDPDAGGSYSGPMVWGGSDGASIVAFLYDKPWVGRFGGDPVRRLWEVEVERLGYPAVVEGPDGSIAVAGAGGPIGRRSGREIHLDARVLRPEDGAPRGPTIEDTYAGWDLCENPLMTLARNGDLLVSLRVWRYGGAEGAEAWIGARYSARDGTCKWKSVVAKSAPFRFDGRLDPYAGTRPVELANGDVVFGGSVSGGMKTAAEKSLFVVRVDGTDGRILARGSPAGSEYLMAVFPLDGGWGWILASKDGLQVERFDPDVGLADPESLPPAFVGIPYEYALTPTGGQPPYRFRLETNQVPEGLQLSRETGHIAGNARRAMSCKVRIGVEDANGRRAVRDLVVRAVGQPSDAARVPSVVGVPELPIRSWGFPALPNCSEDASSQTRRP